MKKFLLAIAWSVVVMSSPAQDNDLKLFNPDSVFTLTEDVIEQETVAANEMVAGTWQYDKPSVQAQGTSNLGKLTKPLAKSKLCGKLKKAYDKLKIKKRWNSLRLDTDGTWTMNVAGKDISGKYNYNPSQSSITLKWMALHITAQVRRDGKHLHLLFDTDRLLTLLRLISGLSSNDTLKALAFLSENYHDVQVGFQLKQKN